MIGHGARGGFKDGFAHVENDMRSRCKPVLILTCDFLSQSCRRNPLAADARPTARASDKVLAHKRIGWGVCNGRSRLPPRSA